MNAISLLGAKVGFSFPALLIAFPLALAVLVYAYLNRGRGTPVVVPSVLILKLLERAEVARKKFIPPLRFFIEFALLALLSAVAAGAFLEGTGERVAVLIDNSFSMRAIDPSSSTADTFLEEALREAKLALESGKASKAELFVTSPKLQSLSNGLTSVAAASNLLSTIKTKYATDSLQSALERLASNPAYSRVFVFSDKYPDTASKGPRVGESSRFVFYHEGDSLTTTQNIALNDVRLLRDSIESKTPNLAALVGNFSTEKVQLKVKLEMLRQADDPTDLRVVRTQDVKIGANEISTVNFENLPNLPIYKVSIDAGTSVGAKRRDSILDDNEAWILSESRKREIVLISPQTPDELGLNKLKAISFTHLTPEKVSDSFLDEQAREANVVIFYNVAPRTLPPVSSIFIEPPEGDALFSSAATINSSQSKLDVTTWLDSHPITTYLNLPALSLSQISTLTVPTWAARLISTSGGVIALAGEQMGQRYAAFGFDLLPFRGKDSPLRSVLLLNCIKWLSDLSASANYELTNRPFQFAEKVKQVLDPTQGVVTDFSEKEGFARPGIYLVEDEAGKRTPIAVNFFDSSESNLLSTPAITLPTEGLRSTDQGTDSKLRDLFILLAVIFLLLECLLWRGLPNLKSLIRRRV